MPLTDEQIDIIREATAYRHPRWSLGTSDSYACDGEWMLQVSAVAANGSRTIWGPHLLGTGTYAEMNKLQHETAVEYRKLTARL